MFLGGKPDWVSDYERDGFVLLRRVLSATQIAAWQGRLSVHIKNRKVERFHPAHMEWPWEPGGHTMTTQPELVALARELFGENVGTYHQRLLHKNAEARGERWVHQDSPYHLGWPNKASFFVAITPMTVANGGLYIFPGSHRLGSLGDAGHIDSDLAIELFGAPINIEMEEGDVAIMHSMCMHGSWLNQDGTDRTAVDIIYQPADDASTIEVVCGRRSMRALSIPRNRQLFVSSRTQKIRDLQNEVDELREDLEWRAADPG